MTDIFEPAYAVMQATQQAIYGPEAFQGYLRRHQLRQVDTAATISIDALEALSPYLRHREVMVFRLGASSTAKGTQFALVQAKLEDLFLFDKLVFTNQAPETFLPTTSMRDLFAYQVLPALSETSYINLGLVLQREVLSHRAEP